MRSGGSVARRYFVALIKPGKKGQTIFGENEMSTAAARISLLPVFFRGASVQAEPKK